MYKNISEKYKSAMKRFSREPKSKIIIDGVTYTGKDIIKTHPKISQESLSIIGEFPAKQCEIELFNRNSEFHDIIGKEIEIFRGLTLEDGSIEYIPQGKFKVRPDDVRTNSTAKTITLSIKDMSVEFDCEYAGKDKISYPTTLGVFIQEIVERHGFVLETPVFPFSDFVLQSCPNFDLNSTTERSLIASASALAGGIAQFNRNGNVAITRQSQTSLTVYRKDYKSLSSLEKQFGPINCVVLGKKGMNDDVEYRDEDDIKRNGLHEWKILDNPFVDLVRKDVIDEVARNIVGLKLIPFSLENAVDSYIYDLNDIITIEDKFGNIVETTILKIESTSRIFTKLGSSKQEGSQTNHKIAGSSQKSIESIKLDVDHVKNEMNLVAERVSDNNKKIAEMNVDVNSILLRTAEVEEEIMQAVESIDEINPIVSTSSSNLILDDSAGKDLIEFSLLGKSYQQVSTECNLIRKQGFSTVRTDTDFWETIAPTVTPLTDGWCHIEADATNTTNVFSNCFLHHEATSLKENTQYTVLVEVKNANGSFEFHIANAKEIEPFPGLLRIEEQNVTDYSKVYKLLTTTKTDLTKTLGLRAFGLFRSGKKGSFDVRVMITEGDYTNKELVYSSYVPNSPSPQFPSQIENIGKNKMISLYVHTKNLLNIPDLYTLTGVKELPINLPVDSYVISWKNITTNGTNNSILLYFHYADNTTLAKYISNSYPSKSLKFSTQKKIVKVAIYSQGNWNESQSVTTTFEELMIEKSTEKTKYVEHQEQTIEIDLQENELCSLLNETNDTLYIKNSHAYLEKRVGKFVFDNKDKYSVIKGNSNVENYNCFIIRINDADKNVKKGDMRAPYANFAKGTNKLAYTTFKNEINQWTDTSADFCMNLSDVPSETENFKEYLQNKSDAGTPFYILYEMQDAVIIDLGECNISTLKDECYIELVDTLETTMSCKYYKNSSITDYFSTKTDTSAQIKIASDSILNEVSQTNQNLASVTTETNNIKLELDKVTQNYERVGGSNKIHDSVGRFDSSEYWTNSESGQFQQGYNQNLVGRTESASEICVRNGKKTTTSKNIVNLIQDKRLFLTYKLSNDENTTTILRIIGNTVLYENVVTETMELKEFEFSFIPNTTTLILEIESVTTQQGWGKISDLMLADSKVWEQAQGETWSRVLETNEFGQLIRSSEVQTGIFMGAEGIGIYELNSNNSLGERVGSLDKNGLLTKKIECTEIIQNQLVKTNININNENVYTEYIRGSE